MEKGFFFGEGSQKERLFLTCCGQKQCPADFTCGPSVRSMFLLHYVISGSGFYEVRGKCYSLHAGDVFVIFPEDLVYYYADRKNPWSFCWVGFVGTAAEDYLQRIGVDSEKLVFSQPHDGFMKSILRYLEEADGKNGPGLRGEACLLECFASIEACRRPDSQEERKNRYASRAIAYMEYRLSEGIRVSEVADFLGLERSYFYRIFRQETGKAPEEYLIDLRVEKAKQYIKKGLDFSNVAEAVGVGDVSYFSKLFKKREGITPSEYRKKLSDTNAGIIGF